MKKITSILIFLLIFTGCKKTYVSYNYYGVPSNLKNKETREKFQFSGHLINMDEEKSYLDYLSIFESKDAEWPTIISSIIKIKENGKEHIIKTKKGLSTSYDIYQNGVKISPDNFIVEFGKIKLEDGQIVELPPIKFTKYVSSERWNVVLDALNQDTPTEEIFQGTIEEYREWKKRNK